MDDEQENNEVAQDERAEYIARYSLRDFSLLKAEM